MSIFGRTKRLIAVLLVCLMMFGVNAYAESGITLHRYLDIPFETATPDMITEILSEQKNISFALSPTGVLSGSASGLQEFGYSFDFHFDFKNSFYGCYRIRLLSSQPSRIPEEGREERVLGDLHQFIDMETQLNELYGEPDIRYFMSTHMDENEKYIRYMFAEENWSLANMQRVCENDSRLQAYSVWNNVVLEIKVDLTESYGAGDYYSYITLYYYPDVDTIEFMRKTATEIYPIID